MLIGLPPNVLKWTRFFITSEMPTGGGHRAERRAVADALGHRDHVGHDVPILVRPVVMAGAAEAALHFVGDADAAVLADDVVHDLEELLGRRDRAADALNRLADEAGDLARRFVLDDVLDVVRALHVARWILQPERAAVAVAGVRVVDVRAVVRS